MNMIVWLAFGAGLVIGTFVGVFAAGLCHAAAAGDSRGGRREDHQSDQRDPVS
jgi:uncharacterized membrane-anchored protein YhcB (DUF1043 family)